MSEKVEQELALLRQELRELRGMLDTGGGPLLFKPPAAAKRIGISVATLWRWIRSGEIDTHEKGKSIYITAREIERVTTAESKSFRASKPRAQKVRAASASERSAELRAALRKH